MKEEEKNFLNLVDKEDLSHQDRNDLNFMAIDEENNSKSIGDMQKGI